ncbi:MAG: hypothetical protein OXC61_03080 [Flavobacteriaceae bacterium]|nr:hypothetical protein [Flavobacteriaceae bacterium]
MNTNKNKRTILDVMDNMELELITKNVKYAEQYLEDEGFDVVEEKKFASQFIRKLQFKLEAEHKKKKYSVLLEKALDKVKKSMKGNTTFRTEDLKSLILSKAPSVQYRKLENWTDDEIRDVLKDVDLLKFIEEADEK